MEFTVKSGHPEKQRTACLVAGVFDARRLTPIAEKLDKASDGYISNLLRRGDIEGKIGQVLLLHNVEGTLADRILLVGCGKERDLGDSEYKEIVAKVVKTLNETGSMEAVSFLSELNVKSRDIHWRIRQSVMTIFDTLYEFNELKSKKDTTRRPLRKLVFMVPTRRELPIGEKAIEEGLAIADGVRFTKDLGNMPANICNPQYLADKARALSKKYNTIHTSVLEEADMENLKMGSLLSVTAGSDSKAKLITMEYRGAKKDAKPIVFVGKGITFDTGGNSLKPPANMIGMKFDMCGAATVFGVMQAVAQLGLKLNVVGVVPTCENMPGPKSTRPDDVITSMSGTTIEVANTDAEGRLILCDALTYSERYNPDSVIDIATLTGAVIVALGRHASAIMSNHNPLAHELLNASVASGDKAWQLPIWDEYAKQLDSPVADVCNIGGPEAGTITAGCFLSKFTKKFHWAHLDVAGTAAVFNGKDKGATGRPVPMLMQYLLDKQD